MRMGERSGTSSRPHAQLLTLSGGPLSGESASPSSVFPQEHKDKTFPNPGSEAEVMETSLKKREKANRGVFNEISCGA